MALAPDPSSVQGTGATLLGGILAWSFDLIVIDTIAQATVAATVSVLIGFYLPKLLNYLHGNSKKNKKPK